MMRSAQSIPLGIRLGVFLPLSLPHPSIHPSRFVLLPARLYKRTILFLFSFSRQLLRNAQTRVGLVHSPPSSPPGSFVRCRPAQRLHRGPLQQQQASQSRAGHPGEFRWRRIVTPRGSSSKLGGEEAEEPIECGGHGRGSPEQQRRRSRSRRASGRRGDELPRRTQRS